MDFLKISTIKGLLGSKKVILRTVVFVIAGIMFFTLQSLFEEKYYKYTSMQDDFDDPFESSIDYQSNHNMGIYPQKELNRKMYDGDQDQQGFQSTDSRTTDPNKLHVIIPAPDKEENSVGDQYESDKNLQEDMKTNTKKNVLFIVADDLRPQLEAYKGPYAPNPFSTFQMHTPNLDKLAKKSLLLTRAYTQFAVCGPSRSSFMTSRRPDTTRVWDLETYWRESGGNFTTIPQHFLQNGYITQGVGKIFHPGKCTPDFDIPSWSEPFYEPSYAHYWQNNHASWRAVNKTVRETTPLPDEQTNEEALKRLQSLAPKGRTGEQPFFLAVGYYKPHMPFYCAEEFYDLYPLEDIEPAPNNYTPHNMPFISWFHSESCGYKDILHVNCSSDAFYSTLPDDLGRMQRRAYFACVSYIDSLVGELLDALDSLGLASNTVVSFIGDHGFHLGENGKYGKHTNFEQATHSPFMIHVPGQTDNGVISNSIVELVDLFPSVVEASGLDPIPACSSISDDINLCTEGTSLMPLISQPDSETKGYAISEIQRKGTMGYTIRTHRFRYGVWPDLSPEDGTELYDHLRDPEENDNVVDHPLYAQFRKDMHSLLYDVFPVTRGLERFHSFHHHPRHN